MDASLARWQALVAARVEFVGPLAEGEPRVTSSAKWRYWKIDLEDGSRVSINFADKAGGRTSIGANHDKVPDAATAERAKAFWKALLAEF